MLFLLMQFVWKYVDDIMGKGVDLIVIFKLLFYTSANIIPMALPIAVLFSSIMTMGNLAESNELTSMKSSGMSLFKVMNPMFGLILLLSAGAFYFSNYVLPVANLKQRTIIYDLQEKKPTFALSEGVFNVLDKSSIKIDKKNKDTGELYGVLIYDPSGKIIRAKKGELLKSTNDQFLLLKLTSGAMYEESKMEFGKQSNYPFSKSFFDETIVKFDLSEFALKKSDEDLFKREYQMMNYSQLGYAIDSFRVEIDSLIDVFKSSFVKQTIIFDEEALNPIQIDSVELEKQNLETPQKISLVVSMDTLKVSEKKEALATTQNKIRAKKDFITMSIQMNNLRENSYEEYLTEWHRKFTLAFAIIVLFFVGAPLGAIIKKGGLGAPLIFATLFFLIYYMLSITGENMIESKKLSPLVGMWMSSIVLIPLGMFLTYKAANDSALFDFDAYKRIFKKIIRK